MPVDIAAGHYKLQIMPDLGGSISRFDWRGEPLMRAKCGPSVMDTACFPLVPFSNRIAFGRFDYDGKHMELLPNFPNRNHPHPLHGFGWLNRWWIVRAEERHVLLRHVYDAGRWPWSYVAEQAFYLSEMGLRHELVLTNLSASPMPAGLGFHPYFPRTERTRYRGLHRGEWESTEDGLPKSLRLADRAWDWWGGAPVGGRTVDTLYTERQGPLEITWPEREISLAIQPSDVLTCTVVYTPFDADFFCVEPVSHWTNAVNQPSPASGLRHLQEGESLRARVIYRASLRKALAD